MPGSSLTFVAYAPSARFAAAALALGGHQIVAAAKQQAERTDLPHPARRAAAHIGEGQPAQADDGVAHLA